MCGFSNAMTFKAINGDDIDYVENFVKNEMVKYFSPRQHSDSTSNSDADCRDLDADLSEEEKPNFFGIYASNPSQFAFMRGERKMLNALVDHVNSVEAENKSLEHFQLKMNGIEKIKISWKGTYQSKIGMHFGEINQYVKRRKVINENSNEEFRNDLFVKFHKFYIQTYRDSDYGASNLNKNMVEIRMVNDSDIETKVQCIFCHQLNKIKKIKIHCQISKNSQFWIFSNLKKHMDKHIQNNDGKSTEEPIFAEQSENDPEKNGENGEDEILMQTNADIGEEEVEIRLDNDLTTEPQYEDLIFTQLSVQNLKMGNAIMLNAEKKQKFLFKLSDTASAVAHVTKIKSDGNCMFGALAHQLFYVKVNSTEHVKATKELRLKSVNFIKENVKLFIHDIKGRVLEKKGEIVDIDKECTFFLNQCLPQAGCWGGFESLKAISCVYKINVLILNESGDYYFANNFNPDYDRSVCIAFREANKLRKICDGPDRNHYDPVVEIKSEIVSECSRNIADKLVKSANNAISSQAIISLDDSILSSSQN